MLHTLMDLALMIGIIALYACLFLAGACALGALVITLVEVFPRYSAKRHLLEQLESRTVSEEWRVSRDWALAFRTRRWSQLSTRLLARQPHTRLVSLLDLARNR